MKTRKVILIEKVLRDSFYSSNKMEIMIDNQKEKNKNVVFFIHIFI